MYILYRSIYVYVYINFARLGIISLGFPPKSHAIIHKNNKKEHSYKHKKKNTKKYFSKFERAT